MEIKESQDESSDETRSSGVACLLVAPESGVRDWCLIGASGAAEPSESLALGHDDFR